MLFFRCASGHEFYSCCLNTPTLLLEAEAWLRERIRTGAIDVATASLSRWNNATQQIESVLGERVDLLAGSIVRMSGIPGDVEKDNQGNRPQSHQAQGKARSND
jgi:hypothetical protein